MVLVGVFFLTHSHMHDFVALSATKQQALQHAAEAGHLAEALASLQRGVAFLQRSLSSKAFVVITIIFLKLFFGLSQRPVSRKGALSTYINIYKLLFEYIIFRGLLPQMQASGRWEMLQCLARKLFWALSLHSFAWDYDAPGILLIFCWLQARGLITLYGLRQWVH